MSRHVLIVDPDDHLRRPLFEVACHAGCHTTTRRTFEEARQDLVTSPQDVLITSVKLEGFNGVHLVYLAHQANPEAICIVYGDDAGLGREAQQAGAFWERSIFLPYTISHYRTATLPPSDRRDVHRSDRLELYAAVAALPRP